MSTGIIDSSARICSANGALDPGELLRLMDEWSIARAVVAPSDEMVAVYNEEGNRRIAEIVRAHPNRLSGLAVANPWYGANAAQMLEAALGGGLVGLYLHPGLQGFHLTDDIVNPLIQTCIAYEKPIYSHTGTPVCAMPFQMAELARRHPDAVFIMGHAGWSDFCLYDVVPACRQAPNIVVETSCAFASAIGRFVQEIGVDRVIFGTGYPRSRHRFEVNKMRGLDLTEEVYRQVMGDNAARLWGIGG